MQYTNVVELARAIKIKINEYNTQKLSRAELKSYISEIYSNENHRAMMYRGKKFSSAFTKTLAKWRLEIFKEIISELI